MDGPYICLFVLGPHHNLRYVINMDQTPVFFSMNAKNTELIGRQTIHLQRSMSDTECAIVAVAITTAGHTLTPIVIFKGVENSRIEKKNS